MMPSKALPFRSPIPKTKRHRGNAYMTIAAGFHCWDGIVLCADTQENVAEYLKRDQCKIEIRPEESISKLSKAPRAIFAGAGYGDFIDYLVDKLWRAMASGGDTADEMIDKAEEELLRI